MSESLVFQAKEEVVNPDMIEAKTNDVFVDPKYEYYTLEELDQMVDKIMEYMVALFNHIKF